MCKNLAEWCGTSFILISLCVVSLLVATGTHVQAQANDQRRPGSEPGAGRTQPALGTASGTSPNRLSAAQFRAKFAKEIQQQGWKSPRIMNPNASAETNSSLILVLRRQQEVAETEKLKVIAAAQGQTPSPPGVVPRLAPGGRITSAANPGVSRPQSSGSVSGMNDSATSSGSGLNLALAPAPSLTANICPPGAVPSFHTVNGQKSGIVFTPDVLNKLLTSQANQHYFYTIQGCHFGQVTGQVSLVGPFAAGTISLAVDTWSDSGIIVHVPSDLSRELDQDNVTLALTISGMQLQAPGMKFYAAREEVLLNFLPANEASLAASPAGKDAALYQSPGFGTFDVQRDSLSTYSPGTDYYGFDELQRGFVPLAFQISPYAPQTVDSCSYLDPRPGMQLSFDGTWNSQWEGNRIRVNWVVSHCHAPKGYAALAPFDNWRTWYGARIWVSGPRGVKPWPPTLH